MIPEESRTIAIFLSAIVSLSISNSLETTYPSGFILPETIPSPCPKTASIKMFFCLTGSIENITPDLSESIIF